MHYKADGSLDMRYSSSKSYVSSGGSIWGPSGRSSLSSNLHYRKDGGLDMRYNSSKQYVSSQNSSSVPLKKDGTPDMRFKSSKAAAMKKSENNIPLKKDGTPDMRFKVSKLATGQINRGNISFANRISDRDINDFFFSFYESSSTNNKDENQTPAIQKYIIDIVSLKMLSIIAANIPENAFNENEVYIAYNDDSNYMIVTKEEGIEMELKEERIIKAIQATNIEQKKLNSGDSELARTISNAIRDGKYPQVIKMQAALLFKMLKDQNDQMIYSEIA